MKKSDIFDFNYLDNLFLIKDEIKGSLIGKSVCLKLKMYSVLLAGHDLKTSNNSDSKDSKKKYGIQK